MTLSPIFPIFSHVGTPDEYHPTLTAERLARLAGIYVAVVSHRMSSSIFSDALSHEVTVGLDGYTAPMRAFEAYAKICDWLTFSKKSLAYITTVAGTPIRVRRHGASLSQAAENLVLGDGTSMWLPGVPGHFFEMSARQVKGAWKVVLQLIRGESHVEQEWVIEHEPISYAMAENPALLPVLQALGYGGFRRATMPTASRTKRWPRLSSSSRRTWWPGARTTIRTSPLSISSPKRRRKELARMTNSRGSAGRLARFSGKALTQARAWRGYSIMRTSRESGVSRETITGLERGDIGSPTLKTIWRLSEPLDVQPQFFEIVPGEVPALSSFHLRSTVRSPPKFVLERLAAKAELFDRITRALEKYVDFPEDSVPRVEAGNIDRVEAAAAACREEFGLSHDGPIKNLTRVLERAGCLVSSYSDEYARTEAFCWQSWRPLVFANTQTQEGLPPQATRLRGNLAHELGHLVLHKGQPARDKQIEDEAWHFARCFLLPRSALRQCFPPMRKRIAWAPLWEIKERWGVPAGLIMKAAEAARMVPPDLASRFFRQLGQRGEVRQESHEPAGFEESPEITRNVARAIESRLGITAAEIATEVGLTPEQATEVSGIDVRAPSNVISFSDARARALNG